MGQPSKDLGSCHTGERHCGDPISLYSGNVFEQETDFTTAGSHPLSFIRYYNSLSNEDDPAIELGSNWRSNYDRYIYFTQTDPAGGSVVAERQDGQLISYDYDSLDNTFSTDSDVTLEVQLGFTGPCPDDYLIATNLDGTVECYGAPDGDLFRLASIHKRDGYTQTLTYNGNYQLTSVTDSFGRSLTFTYTTTTYDVGRLQTLTAPGGQVVTYSYASSGRDPAVLDRLTTVTYATSPASSVGYAYEDSTYPFLLTGVTDENNNQFKAWEYEQDNYPPRGVSSKLGLNVNLTTVTYDDATGNRTVTNALGQQETYKSSLLQGIQKITEVDRTASASVPAAAQTFTYDSNGFVASKKDWDGHLTTFVNDAWGMPTSITEAAGTSLARTTTIHYDDTLHLPTVIYAPRKSMYLNYDGDGNLTRYQEVDQTSHTIPYSTNGQTRTSTYTYDSLGHRLTATDPLNHTTTYTYDSLDNLSTVKDPLGHVTTFTSYTGRGLPQAVIDPNGVTTSFSYDIRGRLLTSNVAGAITSFTYDAAGEMTQITLPDNSSLYYGYDTAHRLTSVRDSANDRITYTLDTLGDIVLTQISNPSGTLTKTQSRIYDTLGRLQAVIGASSQRTTYSYDSQSHLTSIKDALGNVTTQAYDALNRLLTVTDPLSKTTTFGYNSQDTRISVKDPRGLTTSSVTNGFGEVIQEVSPDRGTTVYYRDAAGNVTYSYDARGPLPSGIGVATFAYDALNREISRTYPNYSSEDMTFSYDSTAGGNKGIGRLTGYTDESGQTTLTYDERGNVTNKTRTIGTFVYSTTYAYDKADHVTKEIYPSGRIVTFVYDSAGRVGTVTTYRGGVNTTLASGIDWLPFGPVKGLDLGNGVVSTFTYDQDYRETGIDTGKSGLNVQDLTLVYDAVNDITSITDALDGNRTQTFTYDKDYRVASAHSPTYGYITYTYDGNGNRSIRNTGQVTTYTYEATTNRLTGTNKAGALRTFTYTAAGGMDTDSRDAGTSDDVLYGYGGRGMEHAFTKNGTLTSTSEYTAFGERVLKWVSGVQTTHYHYDEHGHLIAEGNGNLGNIQKEYIWLGDMPLATADSSGNIYYVHSDQIGTPQKITGSGATPTIVWDRVNQPFGEPVTITGTLTYNLGFPGMYYDSEQFLYYNGVRTYDQSTGREIVPDLIGWAGTTTANRNLYGYANQNPVRWSDPTGLLVEGTYNKATGILTITDVDTGQRVDIHAKSGGNPWGDPIPDGRWDILSREGRAGFYRLDKEDASPYNDIDDDSGRSHFRLHHPGRTIGCIAAEDNQGWNQVDDMLQRTKTSQVPDNFRPWWKVWGNVSTPITYYGKITVK
jgi:RHS repeat-associated protein